jgi:hypothetical protein
MGHRFSGELLTLVVAQNAVQVELGVVPVTIDVLETGTEHVVVINADVLGGVVERHCEVVWGDVGDGLVEK